MPREWSAPRRISPENGWHRLRDSFAFRVGLRGGGRQLVFGPGAVVTLAHGAQARTMLAADIDGGRQAGRDPFWAGLPAPALGIGGLGLLRRRYRITTLDDFPAVADIVSGLLEAALARPRVPAIGHAGARDLLRHLQPADRATLGAALATLDLPATSMHGDLHLFNFVVGGAGYRLIDWEHFDPRGSFVYDFIDFLVSSNFIEVGGGWQDLLATIGPEHRAISVVAGLLDADPALLRAYYLLIKIDTVLGRADAARRAAHGGPLLAVLARAVAALREADHRRRPGRPDAAPRWPLKRSPSRQAPVNHPAAPARLP